MEPPPVQATPSPWVFGGPWSYEAEPSGEATGEDAEWLREAISSVGAVVGGR